MTKKPTVSEEDRKLFRDTVGACKPLKRDKFYPNHPKKSADFTEDFKEQTYHFVTYATGEVKILSPEEKLFYAKSGMSPRQMKLLKKGHITIEAVLDLHGLTLSDAEEACQSFILKSHTAGFRAIQIIHGKGHPASPSLIKSHVNAWLREEPLVNAFVSCIPAHGGTGAVYVLLAACRAQRDISI